MKAPPASRPIVPSTLAGSGTAEIDTSLKLTPAAWLPKNRRLFEPFKNEKVGNPRSNDFESLLVKSPPLESTSNSKVRRSLPHAPGAAPAPGAAGSGSVRYSITSPVKFSRSARISCSAGSPCSGLNPP